MDRFGLVMNLEKRKSIDVAKKIIQYLQSKNKAVFLPPDNAEAVNYKELSFKKDKLFEDVDCILVLGGDGTLLKAARDVADKNIPLLGINLGNLGFLTEMEPENIFAGLDKILRGEYFIEERMMLKATIERDGKILEEFIALNDIVVTKGAFARIVDLEVYVGSRYVATYRADGIIIATPTGSTAYSLSAGGPIVYPDLQVIIFTPVCPHTLHTRPMIVAPEETVKVVVCSKQKEMMLTLDGQYGFQLKRGDVISVTKSNFTTMLVRLKGNSFFSILRKKLRDGGAND